MNLVCSGLAGFVAAVWLPYFEIGKDEAFGFACRAGVRRGLVSAVFASGLTLVTSVWRALHSVVPDTDMMIRLATGQDVLVFGLSLLSCVLSGFFGASVALPIRKPDVVQEIFAAIFHANWRPLLRVPIESAPGKRHRRPLRWIPQAILALALVAWISPVVLLVTPLRSTINTATSLSSSQPSPYRYERPQGIDVASTSEIAHVHSLNLPISVANAPIIAGHSAILPIRDASGVQTSVSYDFVNTTILICYRSNATKQALTEGPLQQSNTWPLEGRRSKTGRQVGRKNRLINA